MITLQTKKNIDIIAPLLLAAGVVFLYFKKSKKNDWKIMAILALITFGIGYIISTRITRAVYEAPPPIKIPADVSLNDVKNYDPKPLAQALRADLYRPWYSVGFRDLATYRALLATSNAEFTVIYKYWYANYYQENKETLAQAIAADGSRIMEPIFYNLQESIAARFASLGLQ